MDTTGYKILLLVHVLSVVVAFGGNFVQPMLARAGNVSDEAFGKAVLFIQLPAVILMWVAGMGLVGMSDDVIEMTQTWIAVALVVFVAAAVLLFLIGRAYRAGSTAAVPAFTGVLHVLLVVGLYLMIWKPGLA